MAWIGRGTAGDNRVVAADAACLPDAINIVEAVEAPVPSKWRRVLRHLCVAGAIGTAVWLWQTGAPAIFGPQLGTGAFALPAHTAFLIGYEHGIYARTSPTGPWRSLLRTDSRPFWRVFGPAKDIWSLASAGDYRTLYVGTADGYVFRSTDGGVSWSGADLGTETRFGNVHLPVIVTSIVVDPRNRSIVYAAGAASVYKSTDAGVSWRRLSFQLSQFDLISHLAVDRQQPDSLWLGTTESGLYHSADGGEHWAKVSGGGLPAAPDVSGLALLPANGQAVYASLANASDELVPSNGLYESRDGGRHWTHLWRGLPSGTTVYNLAISPVPPYRMYTDGPDGEYVSTDGGKDWVQDGSPGAYAITADPVKPLTVYGVNNQGVIMSVDGGMHWKPWGAVGFDIMDERTLAGIVSTGSGASGAHVG